MLLLQQVNRLRLIIVVLEAHSRGADELSVHDLGRLPQLLGQRVLVGHRDLQGAQRRQLRNCKRSQRQVLELVQSVILG